MKMKSIAVLSIFLSILLACSSCDTGPTLPPTTSGGGFFVQTFGQDNTVGVGVPFAAPFIQIHGDWVSDSGVCPAGNAASWTLNSGPESTIMVTNGRVCAYWNLLWQTPAPWAGCATLPPDKIYVPFNVQYMDLIQITCILQQVPVIESATGFSFTPTPTYTGVTTGTITAVGHGFTSTYGMPLFQYFDTNGNLVAQTTATSVAPDGSSASGPVPSNIGSVPAGIYLGSISNANASGGYNLLSTATLNVVAGNPPPPPPPPPPPGTGCKPACTQVTQPIGVQ